jgi:hypothetical protein
MSPKRHKDGPSGSLDAADSLKRLVARPLSRDRMRS